MNLIFSVCAYSQSEPSNPKSEKWFRLEPGNVYVEDLLLKPSETKESEISTEYWQDIWNGVADDDILFDSSQLTRTSSSDYFL